MAVIHQKAPEHPGLFIASDFAPARGSAALEAQVGQNPAQ
jgi:hypothetical protein